MGWKYINGRPYYYRSRREAGRVVTTYCGNLEDGRLFAALDAEDRRKRQAAREEEWAERRRADEEEKDFASWFARVESVAESAMIAAGYHKHHRSQWRRRRMATELVTADTSNVDQFADRGAVEALMSRAINGDETCLPALYKLFRDPKHAPALIAAFGSPPSWLETELIAQAKGKNLAIGEASALKLAEIRRELAGPDPSPTERLLAERAALCWWLVYRYEAIYAGSKELNLRQADFQQRRIDRTHARFLSALKTLATVRKLAVPALQVNIGNNQLNTSAP